jgi:DNA-binding beta-propeller fold protein YncE
MTRRDLLAGGALALSAACGRKKGTGYSGYALIATAGDSSVSAIDLTAFRLVKTIPLAAPPSAVIAGSEGTAYVLTPSNGTISLIDKTLTRALTRAVAEDLNELRLSPDGKRLIGVAADSRELLQIDPANLNVLRRQKLRDRPTGLDVSKDGYVAVASSEAGTLELFRLGDGKRSHAQLNGPIGSVRFRQDGGLLLVARTQDRSLTVLNVPDLQVIADLPLAMKPQNLCFTPNGGQLFVSGEGMDAVAIVFPYRTLEVEQTVLAGRDPGVMACSDSPSYLFVANNSGSDIAILNVANRKMIGAVQVGQTPRFIAITPDEQYALVLDEASGDMAVLHIPAIRIESRKSGAALFTLLPVGDQPVHCAIVPRQL